MSVNPDELFRGFVISLIVFAVITGYLYFRYKYFYLNPFKPRVRKQDIREILDHYFIYYQKLSPKDKRRFETKVQRFIYSKDFIPRKLKEVTLEMKVLIAACFVQLTFGFPNINLAHFTRILVYPDAYYSTINRRYHKGEVNPGGKLIVLSWKSFVDGYIHPNDSINLGLHEMAHALRLENKINNHEYKFLDPQLLGMWQKESRIVMEDIRDGKVAFFRKYAEVNDDEFFAVAIENFFERPEEFKENLPVLYNIMTGLLRQDPLSLYRATE